MRQGRLGSVARNSLLSLAALVLLGATRIVYGVFVSRTTDPETFGVVGVLTAVAMISTFLLPAGLASATSRFVPFDRGRGEPAVARGIHRLIESVGIVAAVALSVAAMAWVSVVLRRSVGESLEAGLLTFAYSLYTTEKAALYAFDRVARYVRMELLNSVLVIGLTVAVVVTGSSLYLWPWIVGYTAFAVGARLAIRPDTSGPVARPEPRERRELVGYVVLACLGSLGGVGFLQATQLLAAQFGTSTEVAYFTAAVTLIAPLYFMPRAIALALFPAMSEAHGAGDIDGVRRQADLTTRALWAVTAPLVTVGILVSQEVLTIFGGPGYAAGAYVLDFLLVAAFLAIGQVAAVNALSSGADWQLRIPVGWSLAGAAIGLGVVALVGPAYGAVGVGGGYLVGTAVGALGPIVVVWRRYRMPWLGTAVRSTAIVTGALVLAPLLSNLGGGAFGDAVLHFVAALAGGVVALIVLRSDLAPALGQVRGRPSPVRPSDLMPRVDEPEPGLAASSTQPHPAAPHD